MPTRRTRRLPALLAAVAAALALHAAPLLAQTKKDTLVLYTLDRDGDRCITKKLERGAFLLPVPAEGEKYVVLAASKVASLFRA